MNASVMPMTDRLSQFVRWLCVLILAVLFASSGCATHQPLASSPTTSQPDYPFKTLAAAWDAARFDPTAKDAAFFVATSDIHYPTGANWLPKILDEVNGIQPRPRFFLIAGDLIVSASIAPGWHPNAMQLATAYSIFSFRPASGM